MIEGALPRLAAKPPQPRPRAITIALQAILIAVFCGIGETVLRAALMLDRPDADVLGLLPVLAIRTAIYLAVIAMAFRMAAGAQWARWTLIIGLGTIGLASLVIEPLTTVLEAPHMSDLVVNWTAESLVLAQLRIVHIVAVLVAVPAMLRAGSHFRPIPAL